MIDLKNSKQTIKFLKIALIAIIPLSILGYFINKNFFQKEPEEVVVVQKNEYIYNKVDENTYRVEIYDIENYDEIKSIAETDIKKQNPNAIIEYTVFGASTGRTKEEIDANKQAYEDLIQQEQESGDPQESKIGD